MLQAATASNLFNRLRASLFGAPRTRAFDHTELALLDALAERARTFRNRAASMEDKAHHRDWYLLAGDVEDRLVYPLSLLAAQGRRLEPRLHRLLQDALWELSAVTSINDGLADNSIEDQGICIHSLDEAAAFLTSAQQVAA